MSRALAAPIRLPLVAALAVLPAPLSLPRLRTRPLAEAATGRWAPASHTCGVLRNGKVRCWGRDDSGQTDVPPALR